MKNSIPSNAFAGSVVAQGQQIGTIGSSGLSNYPHLHFEVGNTFDSGTGLLSNRLDPFNVNLNYSLWTDQCSLPIYNLPGQTFPAPPVC